MDVGDYIGMESGVDLNQNENLMMRENVDRAVEARVKRDDHHQRWEMRRMGEREYPPPIPSMARTMNVHSHMPWVMRRYHTCDGRLVIREEKVNRHEYLRAHRSNGRLTLQLVPIDYDSVLAHDSDDDDDNVELAGDDDDDDREGGDEMGGGAREGEDPTVVIGGGKCYDSVRSSSCVFGVLVPAIRPVHI